MSMKQFAVSRRPSNMKVASMKRHVSQKDSSSNIQEQMLTTKGESKSEESYQLYTFQLPDQLNEENNLDLCQLKKYSFPLNGVIYLATSIGFDLDFDYKKFGWLLNYMLAQQLPFAWTRQIDPNGQILYYNSIKRYSTKKHPCWLEYRRVFADAILKISQMQKDWLFQEVGKSKSQKDGIKVGVDILKPPSFIQTCPIYMVISPEQLVMLSKTFRISVSQQFYLLWVPRMIRCLPLPPLWCRCYDQATDSYIYRDLQNNIDLEYHPADLFGCKLIDTLRRKYRDSRINLNKIGHFQFYDSLMRPYTCDIRTLKQLEKKKVNGINQRVKSLQASTGVAAMFQEMSHQKRMSDLIQLYRKGIESTVLEMSKYEQLKYLLNNLELSDKQLFMIFNQLNLNIEGDLHHLYVISDVILEKRNEIPMNQQNQNDSKYFNSIQIGRDIDSNNTSDQSRLNITFKNKSLKKRGEIEGNLKDGLWEFRQSDQMVNYWVSMATGRISYSCPFLQIIKSRINKSQKKSKAMLSKVVPRDLNIQFIPPQKRVSLYMKIKEVGVTLIKNILKKHCKSTGLQLFSYDEVDNKKKKNQSSRASPQNFGKYGSQKSLQKVTQQPQSQINFKNQAKNHQNDIEYQRSISQISPSCTGQIISQDDFQIIRNPWEDINFDEFIDFQGFKQENGIEFLSNEDLLNLMFSWPFTTISSLDTQIPLHPPTQIKIVHNNQGKISQIVPAIPIQLQKSADDLKRSKSRQRSTSRESLKRQKGKLTKEDSEHYYSSQQESFHKTSLKPKGMSELFSKLKRNLGNAIKQADQRIAKNKTMKIKKRGLIYQKEGVISETKLMKKIFDKQFIEKVRRKISTQAVNNVGVDTNLSQDNFQSSKRPNRERDTIKDNKKEVNIQFRQSSIRGKQKNITSLLPREMSSCSSLQSSQSLINLSKLSLMKQSEEQKELNLIKRKTTKTLNKSFSMFEQKVQESDLQKVKSSTRSLTNNNNNNNILPDMSLRSSKTPTSAHYIKKITKKIKFDININNKPSPESTKKYTKDEIPFAVASSYKHEQDSQNRSRFQGGASKIQTPVSQFRNIQSRQAFAIGSDFNFKNDRQFSPFERMRQEAIRMLGDHHKSKRFYYDYEDYADDDTDDDDNFTISSAHSNTKLDQDNEFQKFAKKLFLQMARKIGDPLGSKSQLTLLPPKPNISVQTIKFMANKLGINKYEEPDLMWIAQQAVLISPLPRTLKLKRNFIELNIASYDRKLTKIGYEYFKCLLNSQRSQREDNFKELDVSDCNKLLLHMQAEDKENYIVKSSWIPLFDRQSNSLYYFNFANDRADPSSCNEVYQNQKPIHFEATPVQNRNDFTPQLEQSSNNLWALKQFLQQNGGETGKKLLSTLKSAKSRTLSQNMLTKRLRQDKSHHNLTTTSSFSLLTAGNPTSSAALLNRVKSSLQKQRQGRQSCFESVVDRLSRIGYRTTFKQQQQQKQKPISPFIPKNSSNQRRLTQNIAQNNYKNIKHSLLPSQSQSIIAQKRNKIISKSNSSKQHQLKKVCTVQKPIVLSKYKNRLARLPQNNSSLSTNIISTENQSKNVTAIATPNKYGYESVSFQKSVRQLVVHKLRNQMPRQIQHESPLRKSKVDQKNNNFKRAFTPNTLVKRAKEAFNMKEGSFLPGLTYRGNAISKKSLLLNKREQSKRNLFKQL